MSVDDDLTRWKYLSEQAKQGLLTLSPDAATAYWAACQTLISGLASAQSSLKTAGDIDGLGKFAWATELRTGLNGVAVGTDNSAQDTLNKYMQVAQLMGDTVNSAVRTLTGHDIQAADGIRKVGGK